MRARIAAHSQSPKCLYFFGELPDQLSMLYSDPRLEHIRCLVRGGHLVTCLYSGENKYAEARRALPVDVEVHGLSSMTTNDVDDYCKASDVIVVAAHEEQNPRIKKILGDHLGKIIRAKGVPQ